MCERLGRLYDQCARLAAEGAALAFVDGDFAAGLRLLVEANEWSSKRDDVLLCTLGDDAPIN